MARATRGAQPKASIVVVRLAGTILVDGRKPVPGVQLLLLRLARRVEIWALSVASHPDGVAAVWREAV